MIIGGLLSISGLEATGIFLFTFGLSLVVL